MLIGHSISLRPVRHADVEEIYAFHIAIANRGDYFPWGVMSESRFRHSFEESGFWEKDEGMLLIVDDAEHILGHIEFFKTVNYLDELELSYQIYDEAARGKGYTSEAVNLMVRYLFGRRKENRIRLVIHPDNLASRRVAEKCGFTYEGLARGAWYHKGRFHDVAIYSILHDEVELS